jgi:hypothetical protein
MMRTYRVSFSSFLALALASSFSLASIGCGTYRVVKKTQNGGEVALEGVQSQAREKAEQYMASQCPTGYDIVEEGEAVVGSESTSETTGARTIFGQPAARTTTSSNDKREWRIQFKCRDARTDVGGAPASGPMGPQARARDGVREVIVRF